jgi:hypothetical protein
VFAKSWISLHNRKSNGKHAKYKGTEATMNSVIYVGMDFHKESIAVAVLRDSNRNVEFERQIRNEPGQVKKFFKRMKEKEQAIIACYEAGPCGYTLYRLLEEL